MAANDAEKTVGQSFVRREAADLTFLAFVGDITGAEMQRVMEVHKEAVRECSYFLQIVDLSRIKRVDAEARKVGASYVDDRAVGTAIFGGSFPIRVLAKLVTTATAALGKVKPIESPAVFFDTEEEARAWIEKRRVEVLKRRGGGALTW